MDSQARRKRSRLLLQETRPSGWYQVGSCRHCLVKSIGSQNLLKKVETEIWRIVGDKVIGDADVQEIVEASKERSEVFSGTTFDGVVGC